MSISSIGSQGLSAAYTAAAQKKKTPEQSALNASATKKTDAVQEFLTYAHMNPAERLRAAYLKSHNLTEEELAAKPPAERQKIEDAIKKEIEEKLKKEAEDKAMRTNILV